MFHMRSFFLKLSLSLLFIGVSGWFSPRLAHDVTWNRTANITGGMGKNVSLDYMDKENRGFQGKSKGLLKLLCSPI